jgi:dephospho-CoA kinase
MILLVSGLPASGKTTVGGYLSNRGWALVESGKVAASLLESPDFHGLSAEGQNEFRARALALVRDGHPNRLSREIAKQIELAGEQVAVIGVRHVATLRGLQEICGADLSLVYVNTSPETCAQRFATRDQRTPEAYAEVLKSGVEADQESLRESANVLLDNEGSLEELPRRIDEILQKVGR